jgi:glycosyltransferase involved in cell wall biosynthesis
MKVHATTAMREPGVATYLPLFKRLAEQDRFRVHSLCDDAEQADLILFLDGHQHYRDLELNAIRRHPLVIKFREKAFVYSEVDQPWCAMPGLYVAMPKSSFDPQRQRACAYLNLPNNYVTSSPEPDAALLFSFMGRTGNRTRERILRLSHPRAHVVDTSAADFFGSQTEEIERQKQQYAEVIARSKFVLCPRGAGPSSFRIFETMAAGRVPVILSDEWVPPAGPDWENCAVFIPEKRVEEAGAILEKHEERFPRMAAAARREWEEWFAPETLFHRMTEALKEIVKTRGTPESVLCRKVTARYLRLRARALKGQIRDILRPGRLGQRPANNERQPLAAEQ